MAQPGHIAIVRRKVYENAQAHVDHRPRPDFHQLVEEVLELSMAIRGNHEHPIEIELIQIGGIVLNWLADIEEAKSGRVLYVPLEVKRSREVNTAQSNSTTGRENGGSRSI